MPARFCGPPGSANGGYVCGRLASYVDPPAALGRAVAVTLRQPPPLDTPMHVVSEGPGGVRLMFGGAVMAEAAPAPLDVDAVDPVPYGRAAELASDYPGWRRHPFPGCFVCGPARPFPDGLGLRPGPLPDRPDCAAAAWTPHSSLAAPGLDAVPAEIVWAALDCPGGWSTGLAGRPAVLGRMTAQVDALPTVGERCVVMGRLLGRERRKAFTATTLYDGDGRVLGRAHATWIEVDPSAAGQGAG